MVTTNARLFQRRRTAAQWAAENPTLAVSEIGVVTDTLDKPMFKLGDGTKAWNSLGWFDGRAGISVPSVAMTTTATRITTQGLPRIVLPTTGTTTVYVGGYGFPTWWFKRGIVIGFDVSNDHTATGDVRWQFILRGFGVGGDIDTPETAHNETVTLASPAANGGYTTLTANGGNAILPTPGAFGSLYVLEMSRIGDDAADTHAGNIGLAEVAFIPAS